MMARGYSLQLIFKAPKKNQVPDGAVATIGLHYWSEDEKGIPTITPHCVTISEMRYAVKRLKRELDAIERDAAKRFAAFDKRIAEWRRNYRASRDAQK
jgi:hypothetical protein